MSAVDLVTRRVDEPDLDSAYAEPIESLGSGARIVRIDAGPPGYIPKEALWDHLDTFVDNLDGLFRPGWRTAEPAAQPLCRCRPSWQSARSPSLAPMCARTSARCWKGHYAAGILEAFDHYDFFGGCQVPDRSESAQ